eukprot:TRINITY_DN10881_c0_g1_i1.p1 TRINITY_DN10881_c0_g1~~TRINITY_DN10881_c0_g1_i1.p1  ORF type:complete len:327 (-),score=22.72 TRINITY_DN10881_c0_g1_i1:275-1255(-)
MERVIAGKASFDSIPLELLGHIFAFVPVGPQLVVCCLLNKTCCSAAYSDTVWEQRCIAEGSDLSLRNELPSWRRVFEVGQLRWIWPHKHSAPDPADIYVKITNHGRSIRYAIKERYTTVRATATYKPLGRYCFNVIIDSVALSGTAFGIGCADQNWDCGSRTFLTRSIPPISYMWWTQGEHWDVNGIHINWYSNRSGHGTARGWSPGDVIGIVIDLSTPLTTSATAHMTPSTTAATTITRTNTTQTKEQLLDTNWYVHFYRNSKHMFSQKVVSTTEYLYPVIAMYDSGDAATLQHCSPARYSLPFEGGAAGAGEQTQVMIPSLAMH